MLAVEEQCREFMARIRNYAEDVVDAHKNPFAYKERRPQCEMSPILVNSSRPRDDLTYQRGWFLR